MLKNYFIKNKKFVKNATKIKIKINKIHGVIFEIISEVFWFYIFEKLHFSKKEHFCGKGKYFKKGTMYFKKMHFVEKIYFFEKINFFEKKYFFDKS